MKKLLPTFIAVCSLFAETTHHLWNDCLPYQAKTGTIELRGDKEEVTGRIFYTAYTKEFAEPNQRPITFCFNGGPGSSSVWLHMGAFGPKRVITLEEGASVSPPYSWIENKDSLLDVTDLVFIDPMGTGLSRPEKEQDPSQFWGVEEDLQSICQFISSYLSENGRWSSPKYLAGESYGTTRCAGLSDMLQNQHGIYLNGLVMISCAVDFKTLFDMESPLPQILSLPTFTATAWHHQRLPNITFEEAIQKSKTFANGPYATALLLGKENDDAICKEIAYLTGLPLEFVLRKQGRISFVDFRNEFFGNERKVLGAYDTTLIGDQLPNSIWDFSTDPSISLITGIYTGTFNSYLQKELGQPTNFPHYRVFCEKAHQLWKFPAGENLNLTACLRRGMIGNPELKIFMAAGYFDLVTPFAAADYTLDQLHIQSQDRIISKSYQGGHMFYLHPESLHQFHKDLVQFYKQPPKTKQAIKNDPNPKQAPIETPALNTQVPQTDALLKEPTSDLLDSLTIDLPLDSLEEQDHLALSQSIEWGLEQPEATSFFNE